ncbi:hypothetical protein E2F46_12655 [Luteimonas aestuarii]|uniref:Uncharacterized protein n=1 Tax=Luteimonas aestuarii TaxID=453837 RepID=A0A4R5TSC7_9GAMM|nr:hypothetical protein [Luteimonas aestuarii]TDK22996.1 hypothetical protein E2F46_12655 [Luteimonas aestuarii]
MRTLLVTSIAAIAILAAAAATSVASQPAPATFEQCAMLLPQGKIYTFEITGSVDTTAQAATLSGELSVSDGTQVDRSDESAAFGQCVARLLR